MGKKNKRGNKEVVKYFPTNIKSPHCTHEIVSKDLHFLLKSCGSNSTFNKKSYDEIISDAPIIKLYPYYNEGNKKIRNQLNRNGDYSQLNLGSNIFITKTDNQKIINSLLSSNEKEYNFCTIDPDSENHIYVITRPSERVKDFYKAFNDGNKKWMIENGYMELQKGNNFKLLKGFQRIRVGRFLDALGFHISNLETSINNYKANYMFVTNSIKYELFTGDDVPRMYHTLKTEANINSCMTHQDLDYVMKDVRFKLYKDNPETVGVLVAYCEGSEGKKYYAGRAIHWIDVNGDKFLDRIYTTSGNVNIFDKYKEDNKAKNTGSNSKVLVKVNIGKNDRLPYLDTLTYINRDRTYVSNRVIKEPKVKRSLVAILQKNLFKKDNISTKVSQ